MEISFRDMPNIPSHSPPLPSHQPLPKEKKKKYQSSSASLKPSQRYLRSSLQASASQPQATAAVEHWGWERTACCYMSYVSATINWSLILCPPVFPIMLTFVFTFSEYAVVLLLVAVSVQQTRWHRKSSRTAQRSKAKSSHEALHFLDFSPAASEFICIWPCTDTRGARCRKPLGENRQWANTLRNTIADDSPYSGLVQAMLERYVKLCLCHRHRPKTPTDQIIIDGWVQQWLTQLRALYDGREGIPPFTPTTVPIPTSEDGSSSGENSTASNTPVKCETYDPSTPLKDVPGSFPCDDISDNSDMSARRSSTPKIRSAREYSELIRNSPPTAKGPSPKSTSTTKSKKSSAPTTKFEPYSGSGKTTPLSVLSNPLGAKERTPGHVYIFTRRSNNDSHSLYVKIGAAKDVKDRLAIWQTKCGYRPHWEYETAEIPNALRVEALVHMELINYRRIERKCSGCAEDHKEWFETDVETARPFVERWAEWMQKADPYTEDHQLSSHIVKKMFIHKLSEDHLTSENMLSIVSDQVATQPASQAPPPGSPERRGTVALNGLLDPASPTSRKSALTDSAADLVNNWDVEGCFEPKQGQPPSIGQVQIYSKLNDDDFDDIGTWRRVGSVKDALVQASKAIKAECKEVKVKVEPEHDLYDPLVYGEEASDSQAAYYDAESFLEQSPASTAAKEELDASLMVQQQTVDGPLETPEVPACGD
jgi:hypothetical protein